ncbi:MAG: STT3 domain-containing protein [archaeon]
MAEDTKSKDEGTSFDISNMFKREKKSKSKAEHKVKETGKEKPESKRTSKSLNLTLIIVLIVIALFFSIYFRSYPATLPVAEDWAESTVQQNIRNQIAGQVNQQYPNLPADQKTLLINQEYAKFLESNKGDFNAQIKSTAEYFKSQMQNEDGQTYLLAIDPYQHYRQTMNIVENGHPGDELRNPDTGEQCSKEGPDCVPWNTYKKAPLGSPVNRAFHTVFTAWFFKFIHFFNKNATVFGVLFWVPVLMSALCVIPAFFIAKRKVGLFGGFVAAMFVAIHPAFIGRTAAGFADTDAYTVLFPLLILWTFLEAFEAKTWKKKLLLTIVSGFFVGLFAFSWNAWWFAFDLIVAAILVYLWFLLMQKLIGKHKSFAKRVLYFILSVVLAPLYIIYLIQVLITHLRDKTKRKDPQFTKIWRTAVILLLFVGFSFIFVTAFSSAEDFAKAPTAPLQRAATLKAPVKGDIWPNVYTTVAELNPASINSIINQIGGRLFFIIASLGVVFSLLPKAGWKLKSWLFVAFSLIIFLVLTADAALGMDKTAYFIWLSIPMFVGLFLNLKHDDEVDVKYAILLLIWFVSAMFATTKGTRFTLLLVPAFAVAMGIALGYLYHILSKLVWREFRVSKIFSQILLIVVLLLLLIAPMRSAHETAVREVPSMDDAWYDSLTGIKEFSEPDAIINSWWDFGHWFKAFGDRAVTFDGGSQNQPMAHWIGHVLITGDEKQAIGILRMLDCGSNRAYEKLSIYTGGENLTSINILYDMFDKDQAGAKQVLLDNGLSDAQSEDVLKYTHCNPPENYFITSQDMVGKAGVWGHFGSWDFEKAASYSLTKDKRQDQAVQILKDELGFTEEEANDRYYTLQSLTTDNEVNAWISPWPNYVSGSMSSCTNYSADGISCTFNRGVGRNPDGTQDIIVERGSFNLSDPSQSQLVIGFYLRGSGAKVGENTATPRELVMVDEDGFTHHEIEGSDFSFSIILEEMEDGTYKALMCDPLFAESTFTKLFYMGGRHTEHFDEFSSKTNIRGERIVVWKVDWDGKDGVTTGTTNTNVVITEPVGEEPVESNVDDVIQSIMFS